MSGNHLLKATTNTYKAPPQLEPGRANAKFLKLTEPVRQSATQPVNHPGIVPKTYATASPGE